MKECPNCLKCFEDHVNLCPYDGNKLNFSWPGSLIILDKYIIESVLGRGGMGVVYQATQFELERQVAIKVLSPLFLKNEKAARQFRNEALATARLNHPNIIKIYDYGTLPGDGGAYLVMKLLRGHALTAEIEKRGQLPYSRIHQIMQQVCSAIDYAHQNHIIHCDLKPDNIVIEKGENNKEVAQIVDFGIARLRETSGTGSLYSIHTGTSVGTPSYMSPEQCLGERLFAPSDIYSLGVILYEMITGTVPFKSVSAANVALHHISSEPLPPSKFRLDVSSVLDEMVLKSLAKPMSERFQTASEFWVALEEALKINADLTAKLRSLQRTEDLVSDVARFAFIVEEDNKSPVRVTIPESTITSPLNDPPFKHIEPAISKQNFSQLTVLIVDDEPGILTILNSIISHFGCKILMAYDGDEAWKHIKIAHPQLIICDIQMPKVDGWHLFFRYKTDPALSEVPFIFTTSINIQDEKVSALEQGVEDYWLKPFVIPEITVRIKRLLQRVNTRRS